MLYCAIFLCKRMVFIWTSNIGSQNVRPQKQVIFLFLRNIKEIYGCYISEIDIIFLTIACIIPIIRKKFSDIEVYPEMIYKRFRNCTKSLSCSKSKTKIKINKNFTLLLLREISGYLLTTAAIY